MTDYGTPVSPGDALREHMKQLAWRADSHRQEARLLSARAQEIDDAIRLLDDAADRYDKYQPSAEPETDSVAEAGFDA